MEQEILYRLENAAKEIATKGKVLIFTGAGISIESGIPTFRGNGGLWDRVDPSFCEIDYFTAHPQEAWEKLKHYFYESYGTARPNPAHISCAEMQNAGVAFALVTQNIDGLHQAGGSPDVIEFHGALHHLVCVHCGYSCPASPDILKPAVPRCSKCHGLLKPDIVFFGEGIPEIASERSFSAAEEASCVLVCGTTGEVMPACHIPYLAKRKGAVIIEVNPAESAFTNSITDYHLRGKAGEIIPALWSAVQSMMVAK